VPSPCSPLSRGRMLSFPSPVARRELVDLAGGLITIGSGRLCCCPRPLAFARRAAPHSAMGGLRMRNLGGLLRVLGHIYGPLNWNYQVNVLIGCWPWAGKPGRQLFVALAAVRPGRQAWAAGAGKEGRLVSRPLHPALTASPARVPAAEPQHDRHARAGGHLDFVLLKPVDSQFWLSARTFSPWRAAGVAAGSCSDRGAPPQVAPGRWRQRRRGPGAVVSSTLIFTASGSSGGHQHLFVEVWNATEVLRAAWLAGRLPVQRLSRWPCATFSPLSCGGFPSQPAR